MDVKIIVETDQRTFDAVFKGDKEGNGRVDNAFLVVQIKSKTFEDILYRLKMEAPRILGNDLTMTTSALTPIKRRTALL